MGQPKNDRQELSITEAPSLPLQSAQRRPHGTKSRLYQNGAPPALDD